ncbi:MULTISPECIES: hypothetical protein [Candidatus Nitrosocaldus]|uniref:Uncharacterized protein n=1 Tax=Candidatus Nitrosocaldus cavascurensis TaxID=2058097 RepID=A0A2K5ANY9_9ARCH|nr:MULTISPECIES: hypothetical protein [Candidatus Nitrosocaldus]SPC33358.1 protein of unknown function [Candidatus Nitrosocaldus cavascurensis]
MSTITEVSEIGIDLDDVIARFMKSNNAYALCERCNCQYDKVTGRHLHTGSNLCSDLFEKCIINISN